MRGIHIDANAKPILKMKFSPVVGLAPLRNVFSMIHAAEKRKHADDVDSVVNILANEIVARREESLVDRGSADAFSDLPSLIPSDAQKQNCD